MTLRYDLKVILSIYSVYARVQELNNRIETSVSVYPNSFWRTPMYCEQIHCILFVLNEYSLNESNIEDNQSSLSALYFDLQYYDNDELLLTS